MGPGNNDQLYALLPLLLVILGLGILSVVGWLVWVFTRPGGRRSTGTDQPAPQPFSDQGAPASSAPQPVPQHAPQHAPQFLTLARGIDGWEIQVRGQLYGSLDAVPDAQTRDEVVDAIRALARFAQAYVQQQRAAGGTPVAAERGTGSAPQPPPSRGGARSDGPARQNGSPPFQRPAVSPPVSPVTDPSVRRAPSLPSMIPSMNLAQEIGEIVDEMLANTPSLHGRAVSLTNAVGGGIAFAVDGKVYRELDQIPDPEIRELIRRATKEWERR